jgi:hypothetical protein
VEYEKETTTATKRRDGTMNIAAKSIKTVALLMFSLVPLFCTGVEDSLPDRSSSDGEIGYINMRLGDGLEIAPESSYAIIAAATGGLVAEGSVFPDGSTVTVRLAPGFYDVAVFLFDRFGDDLCSINPLQSGGIEVVEGLTTSVTLGCEILVEGPGSGALEINIDPVSYSEIAPMSDLPPKNWSAF